MKNFHQNLLVVLAIALCLLCAWQWYGQTIQRKYLTDLNQVAYDRAVAIQDYTNSIATMNHQLSQMDAHVTEMKAAAKTNENMMLSQKREMNRLAITTEMLTNQITQYQEGVDLLQTKLKEAYDGIQKQNEAITNLVTQRDEFVQKLNDEIKDRNDIVSKYNDLAKQIQAGGGKQ
ncbi:MAG TPA: hypothetical protein VH255_03955 [Verrucomicrobiae bacterium]|nr:hypothetical protein [Verrucomicrobiae bacterium]